MLIATNRHDRLMGRMDARPLPIGLAYVAGYLDPSRHSTKVLDLMFADDYMSEVEAVVRDFKPDLVGLSLRNLDNGSYLDSQWALPVTREVTERVRSVSEATIVCGGPAFSILPKECFAYVEPDLGIAGDGGETFAALADRLEASEPYHDLPGLLYREGGNVVFNGRPAVSSFSKPPRLEDLDLERYRQAGFGIGVLTKLGDFWYPAAGSAQSVEDMAWRVIRPVQDVVEEVQTMERRLGLRKVFFIDNGFNIPLDHAKSLCRALIQADLKLHWNTVLAPHTCDGELVALMKEAGCALALMGGRGVDSRDGAALEQRLEEVERVCRLCEEGDLHYTISQGFGEPGETRESVERKLAFLRRLRPSLANLRIGVRIMPGTAEAALALSDGTIADESELIRPVFYMAEPVREWLVEHLQAEAEGRARWNVM